MTCRPLTWLLGLAVLMASGCMLPQPDTPPVPPLFGNPGAQRGAAAPPAREAVRDAVKADVVRDAVTRGEADHVPLMPPAPGTAAAVPPGGIAPSLGGALPTEAGMRGPVAAASVAPPNGQPQSGLPLQGGAVVGDAGPAIADATATVKPDVDASPPASITLNWAPTAGIEAARLVPSGEPVDSLVATDGGPVTLPAGAYAVEVRVAEVWRRLAGTLIILPGEALEVSLDLADGEPRVARTQSRQGPFSP